MKADNKLKVGDMVITLGYYEANDGGGAEYRIVKTRAAIIGARTIDSEITPAR